MNISRIQSAMLRKAGIQKQASWFTTAAKAIGGLFATGTDSITNAALYTLGAAAVAGGGIGAFGAEVTAHGKQDEDTVKKEYENERLKADIGYVASRLEDEYNRSKDPLKPKAARVLNV